MPALLEYVTETTYPLFEQKLRDKPFLLIYPRHRSRTALVAMLLSVYAHEVVYYALSTDDSSLSAWLAVVCRSQADEEESSVLSA